MGPLAYHDLRWRRDKAPLLDDLGAVIDHVEAHSRGGRPLPANLATACNKCNARKSAMVEVDYRRKASPRKVRGTYGEPKDWDGLSALFVALVQHHVVTPTEREWLEALQGGQASLQVSDSTLDAS
jgi:HNH endonuclease